MILREKVSARLKAGAAQYGCCFSFERTQRAQIGRIYGETPGERSVSRVTRQLVREGYFGRKRIGPGQPIPARFRLPFRYAPPSGIALTWPIARQERRAIARAKRKAAAGEGPRMIGDGRDSRRDRRRHGRKALAPLPAREERVRRVPTVEAWELAAVQAALDAIKKPPGG